MRVTSFSGAIYLAVVATVAMFHGAVVALVADQTSTDFAVEATRSQWLLLVLLVFGPLILSSARDLYRSVRDRKAVRDA